MSVRGRTGMADTSPGFRLLARVATKFPRVSEGAAARHVALVYKAQGIPRLHISGGIIKRRNKTCSGSCSGVPLRGRRDGFTDCRLRRADSSKPERRPVRGIYRPESLSVTVLIYSEVFSRKRVQMAARDDRRQEEGREATVPGKRLFAVRPQFRPYVAKLLAVCRSFPGIDHDGQ